MSSARTPDQERIEADAITFAKKQRNQLSRRLTDTSIYVAEECPVSVFMAGSPGAGKTEASIELIDAVKGDGSSILRIDADELRKLLPGYTGDNSWLFQRAVMPLVEAVHDRALKQGQSFIMDGTFSSFEVAQKNVLRSLRKDRLVQILYVYQRPEQAWQFVLARERSEGRRIEPEVFANQYFAARDVVNRLKRELGKQIQVDLLMKNNDGSTRFYKAGVDQIDNYIPEKYSLALVRRVVGLS